MARRRELRCAWAQLKCQASELLFARIGGKGFHERLVRERRRARFVAMADERHAMLRGMSVARRWQSADLPIPGSPTSTISWP